VGRGGVDHCAGLLVCWTWLFRCGRVQVRVGCTSLLRDVRVPLCESRRPSYWMSSSTIYLSQYMRQCEDRTAHRCDFLTVTRRLHRLCAVLAQGCTNRIYCPCLPLRTALVPHPFFSAWASGTWSLCTPTGCLLTDRIDSQRRLLPLHSGLPWAQTWRQGHPGGNKAFLVACRTGRFVSALEGGRVQAGKSRKRVIVNY